MIPCLQGVYSLGDHINSLLNLRSDFEVQEHPSSVQVKVF